jgi:hypothetical protein
MIGWFSVVFEPVTRMTSVCSRSSAGLVIAPEPKESLNPATVEEWHRRAQWSTLFVPMAARTNFWNT